MFGLLFVDRAVRHHLWDFRDGSSSRRSVQSPTRALDLVRVSARNQFQTRSHMHTIAAATHKPGTSLLG